MIEGVKQGGKKETGRTICPCKSAFGIKIFFNYYVFRCAYDSEVIAVCMNNAYFRPEFVQDSENVSFERIVNILHSTLFFSGSSSDG
jgi:ferredoxin-thioredoxin reductase catalytic subunit